MKKRIEFLLAVTLLFFSIFTVTSPVDPVFAASKAKVNVSLLDVREKPTTSSKNLGQLKKGKEVTISQENDSWTKISYGKSYGWISSKYITKIEAAKAPTKDGYVAVTSLYLRKSASTSSTKLATLNKGTLVNIKATSANWINVYVPSKNKTGWVSQSYISDKNPITSKAVKGAIVYVTASSLNIRTEANTKAQVVISVKKDAAVTLYEKSGTWGKVTTPSGKSGWASLTYLTTKAPVKATEPDKETTPETEIVPTTYYVTSNSLNIRKEPNTTAKVLTSAEKNEELLLIEIKGTWGKVTTTSGITGWASLSYLTIKTPADGLKSKVIVIDPGHGGSDPGSAGKNYQEKTLTLKTAKELEALLNVAGAKVIMTRTGDTYPTLTERVNISHKNNADVFISIHYNSSTNKEAQGIDTYYYGTNVNERELARYIQEEVIKATGLKNRGINEGNFQVIRTNSKAAVLVELGFISSPDEEEIIASKEYQVNAATGILKGLEKYFDQ